MCQEVAVSGEDVGWPRDRRIAQLSNDVLALDVLGMVVGMAYWVHRRVETIEFIDEATYRRRQSLHFDMPSGTPLLDGSAVVPLAPIRKEILRDFDAVRENGDAVPILTREQNSAVAATAIVKFAEAVIGDQICPALGVYMRWVVAGSPEERRWGMRYLSGEWRRPGVSDTALYRHQHEQLSADDDFQAILELLGDHFLLIALIPLDDSTHVLKFAYEEQLRLDDPERRLPLRTRISVALGYLPLEVTTNCAAAGQAASYHFEVAKPPGTEITYAELSVDEAGSDEGYVPVSFDAGDRSRVALHAIGVPSFAKARSGMYFSASRKGWLAWSHWSVLWTTALLLLGALWIEQIAGLDAAQPGVGEQRVDTSASVVLAFVGLLGIVLVRPGEHALASKLLRPVRRATIAASAVAPFLAAMSLLISESKSVLRMVWLALGLGSGLVLIVCYWLPMWSMKRQARALAPRE